MRDMSTGAISSRPVASWIFARPRLLPSRHPLGEMKMRALNIMKFSAAMLTVAVIAGRRPRFRPAPWRWRSPLAAAAISAEAATSAHANTTVFLACCSRHWSPLGALTRRLVITAIGTAMAVTASPAAMVMTPMAGAMAAFGGLIPRRQRDYGYGYGYPDKIPTATTPTAPGSYCETPVRSCRIAERPRHRRHPLRLPKLGRDRLGPSAVVKPGHRPGVFAVSAWDFNV